MCSSGRLPILGNMDTAIYRSLALGQLGLRQSFLFIDWRLVHGTGASQLVDGE